ncbi:hypothetical protein D3C72_1083830 [compost metagenome]
MRRVPCEEDPLAIAIPVGDQQMRRPGIRNEDLVLDVRADEIAHQCVRVDRFGLHPFRPAGMQGPDIPVILGDQRAAW